MLGVHDSGFLASKTEEIRIEQFHATEFSRAGDVVFVAQLC